MSEAPQGQSNNNGDSESTYDDVFPLDVPDVAVGGLAVVRTMAAPDGAVSLDDDEQPPMGVQWSISGIPTGRVRPALVMIGDVFLRTDDAVAGVTVSALIDIRGHAAPFTEEEAAERGHDLAPWASHLMYDLAAQEARRSLVTIGQDPSAVPFGTPDLDVEDR